MKLTRNLIAFLALASSTYAFAEDNGVAARYHSLVGAHAKDMSTAPRAADSAHNIQCPGMGGKVDANSPTIAVDGRQYRLCCLECGDKVKADPKHYLNKDGMLTGAWNNDESVNHI